MGRPKVENPKNNVLHIRLTDAEFAEIEKVAKNLKITKTEAVLRGIKNLSQIKSVSYRVKQKKIPKHFDGIIAED